MILVDSHAHLNHERFLEDRAGVLQRASDAGVVAIINVGYDLATSTRALSCAQLSEGIYPTVGVHPHDAKSCSQSDWQKICEMAKHELVVAIGEMGLDYYYDNSPRSVQQELFRAQIRLAKSMQLPIIVHNRDAHNDVLSILHEEHAQEIGGVMHCFSGDVSFAKECLDLGFYISLAGPVTFKNAGALEDVAREVPLERLLIETDSPYLAPVPKRGKRNEPSYVAYVADKVAELRGVNSELVARQTSENARDLFKINLTGLGKF